eukprot:TRINITY_DN616_c0_g3_i1.p1 TRINITY_DN616_c0_g3~~TRINITY_DN616_c0_g3_i1.p1  ORF type:complete len:1196 (-),score=549.69 TRINITY_DN616_c0_g3_i1:108-3239(-)
MWLRALQEGMNLSATNIFNTTVNDACLKANQNVPVLMERIIEELKAKHLDTEGLFRVPGGQTDIVKVKDLFDRAEYVEMKDKDPHLLTGTLKLYLREISDPLFPIAFYEKFAAASTDKNTVANKLKEIVKELPKTVRISIAYMIGFLKEISKHSAKNKMEVSNIAITIAPTIFRKAEKEESKVASMDSLSVMTAANVIIESMIVNYDQIFSPEEVKQFRDPLRDPELERTRKRTSITATEKPVIEPVLKQHYEDIERVFMMRGTAKTLNTKGAFDERIIVAGTHRCYVFQVGGKLEFDVHYMDIVALSTPTRARVRIEYRPPNSTDPKKTNELVIQPSSFAAFDIDFFVQAVCQSYQSNFVGMPRDLKFKLEIEPEARKQQILNGIAIPDVNQGCGGFVQTYRTVCDYYSVPPQENVVWDLENLFYNNDVKSFNLSEFIQKDKYPNPEYQTLITSLAHNLWFNALIIDGQKLGTDGIAMLANVLKTNQGLRVLHLKNVGATKDSIAQLFDAMAQNKLLNLADIDVSNNGIEDKGAQSIADFLAKYDKRLHALDISNGNIGKKGMMGIFEAMQKNTQICATLKKLAIANNKFDQESSRKLGLLLGKAQALRELNLANTQPTYLFICASLEKNQTIHNINCAENKLPAKEQKDFVQFVSQLQQLRQLNVSNTGLTAETLIDVLKTVKTIQLLDISDNEQLGDEGVSALCNFLTSEKAAPNLTELNMNRLFTRRTKDRQQAIIGVSNLIQNSNIAKLRMTGGAKSQLKQDLLPFVFNLINNNTLKVLDISSHAVGDALAIALAKVLQHNRSLHTLFWDDNEVTLSGLKIFKIGLERNKTVKKMPLPLLDLANIIKGDQSTGPRQSSSTDLPDVLRLANEVQQLVFDNALATLDANTGYSDSSEEERRDTASAGESNSGWTVLSPRPAPGTAPAHSAPTTPRGAPPTAGRTPNLSVSSGTNPLNKPKMGPGPGAPKKMPVANNSNAAASNNAQPVLTRRESKVIDTTSLTRASLLFGNLAEALENRSDLTNDEKREMKTALTGVKEE